MKRTPLALAVLMVVSGSAPARAQALFNTQGEQLNVCKLWDGTDLASITPAGRLLVDGSGVTQPISGTVTVEAGAGALVVGDGSGPLSIDGTLTCNAGTGTLTTDPSDRDARVVGRVKLHDGTDVALVSAGGALLVDASATTQPVSGTVTANAGSGTFVVGDGSGALTVDGTVTSNQGGAPWSVAGPAADGSAVSGNPVRLAGKDGSGNTQDVITDSAGELQVDVLTMPAVSGTVTANQGGTWTVQPGNTANTTPWLATIAQGGNSATVSAGGALKVDGSAVTQPVSGTITANAGSGTFTVSGTVTANAGTGTFTVGGAAADGAAVSGNPARIAGKDGSGNTQDVATDTSGELQVDVLTLPNVTVGTFPDNEPFNVAQVAGATAQSGSGTATGALRVELPTNGTGVIASIGSITTSVTPGTGAANEGKAEDAGHNSGDTGVAALAVRQDSNTTFTSANTEYSPIAVDAYGAIWARDGHPNGVTCTADNIAGTLTQLTNCGQPGAGLSIYVTHLIAVSTTTTGATGQLRIGTGTNCGTGTAAFFPPVSTSRTFTYPANNATSPYTVPFPTPYKVTANNALCVIGSATNTINILVLGFIAPG